MKELLNKEAYRVEADNLLWDSALPTTTTIIEISGLTSDLKRGSLVVKQADGRYTLPIVREETEQQEIETQEIETQEAESTSQKTEGASEKATASYIVAENLEIPEDNEEDVSVAVYESGRFRQSEIVLTDGYEITEKDIDDLRIRNIILK